MQFDFSSGGPGREQIHLLGFHLILGFYLIRDHLQPCDEVPVDDCATFAFVLQKPFTVVSDIVPLAVLLPLQSIF